MPRSTYTPKRLNSPKAPVRNGVEGFSGHHSVFQLVEALRREAKGSEYLFYSEIAKFRHGNAVYSIPRFVFQGPDPGDEPVRIGIFAAIHGDEPETAYAALEFLRLLLQEPGRARGYQIYVYPISNPSGVEDGTRHSRSGADLNREFWKGSREPEIYYLERELGVLLFQGVIALHADDTTENKGLAVQAKYEF